MDFPLSTYQKRRKTFAKEMSQHSVAILPSSQELIRNRDAHFPFRQSSDFLYLTGFNEPESVLVMLKQGRASKTIMFCRPRDEEREIWDGIRVGPDGLQSRFGVDEAYTIDQLDAQLPQLLDGADTLYWDVGLNPDFDQNVNNALSTLRMQARAGAQAPSIVASFDRIVHEMRLFKDAKEIAMMQKSADVAADAHCQAMRACKPGMYEYELEAIYLKAFRQNNGVPAYSSIVGGGANACILHYIENNQPLCDGDLVLIDAGAELAGYASDITRTFPVNGKFTTAQQAIYELVLEAQYEAIKAVRIGAKFDAPHDAAVKTLAQGLLDLKIVKGSLDSVIESGAFRPYYMHRTSHWLGLDVHDVGAYKSGKDWRKLEPGMVLTIEPGLYFRPRRGLAKRWWNIGVRIEDDVLVTAKGPNVLTHAVPKTVADIERLMRA